MKVCRGSISLLVLAAFWMGSGVVAAADAPAQAGVSVIENLRIVNPVLVTEAEARVPSPAETPAEVVVSGRTSTLKAMTIVKVGTLIPKTYAGALMKNTPGFVWYVSRHYALKANIPEEDAIEYLMLSELAYPHYVWVVGREPYDIQNTRMAIVYGSTFEDMNRAMTTDVGGPMSAGAGGITLFSNRSAYNFPSGGLAYHKRDLVLHENLHMLVMCVAGTTDCVPVRYGEGMTYALANHVYDKEKAQLTVMVLDKAPANNPYDSGLRELRRHFVSATNFYGGSGSGYMPNVYAIWTQFLWSDPDRCMRLNVWRDEMFRAQLSGPRRDAYDKQLMEALFGPADKLNEVWKAWVSRRQNTFHYVDWGYEQDGNVLWSLGWPNWARYAQKNVNLLLKDAPVEDPLILDYPDDIPMPPTVGPVQRGVEEPAVGCLLDFSEGRHAGKAGLGFGVTGDQEKIADICRSNGIPAHVIQELLASLAEGASPKERNEDQRHLDVLVDSLQTLILDGATLGLSPVTVPLPRKLTDAIAKDRYRVGLTVKVAKQEVQVTLRAGPEGALESFSASIPIAGELRQKLLSNPWALLSKDNKHGFVLFPDVRRQRTPDLLVSAPAGRWRFAGERELSGLYRAAWRLGDKAPKSLLALRDQLAQAASQNAAAQQTAMQAYRNAIARIEQEILGLSDKTRSALAFADVNGVDLFLNYAPDSDPAQPTVVASVRGATAGDVEGSLVFRTQPAAASSGRGSGPQAVHVPAGQVGYARWTVPLDPEQAGPFLIEAAGALTCKGGGSFEVHAALPARPSIPCWYVLGPFDNPGGALTDVAHAPEQHAFALTNAYPGAAHAPVRWQKKVRQPKDGLLSDFVVNLNDLYGWPSNVCAYAIAWADAPKETDAVLAVGSEDGFVAWVNGAKVGQVLEAGRTYASQGDRLPIHLKQGENEIRLKITLTQAGWKFGAHLLDVDDLPLPVKYRLRE